MKHLFIVDPLSTFKPAKDTTLALMDAVRRAGSEVWACTLDDLTGHAGYATARAQQLRVAIDGTPFYEVIDESEEALEFWQVVWMRKDPPFDTTYIFSTYLLDLADPERTLVVNRPSGLRDANEKAFILQFPEVITDTAITRCPRSIARFVEQCGGEAVIKPLDLMGGAGIFILRSSDPNFNSIVDAVTRGQREFVMIQRYLPRASEGDKRIILMDGEPLGAILRVPQGVDFRGNMAAGGIATQSVITDRDQEIIAAVAPALRQRGLWLVGLDIIGDYVTEINVTSPTGVREINRFDNTHIEDAIVGWTEKNAPVS